ncbi:MAG: (Fe-S)-binding protein [Anaerolineales bacterium]
MSHKVRAALEVLETQLNQPLLTALEVCARCGLCAESCHYYLADPIPENVPAARGEALRRFSREQRDPLAAWFPAWIRAEPLTDESLESLAEMAFSRCTLCRRCTFNCPMGVDTPLLMSTVRAMASAAGVAPEMLVMLADAAIEKGRDPETYLPYFLESIHDMELELRRLTGRPTASIPVRRKGSRVLYVALAGAHTILPAAAIFETAGEDWTLSIFEAANYAVFLSDLPKAKAIARRIVDEAHELGVEEIVVSECGHAYHALRWSAPNWFGEEFPFRVRSIVEVIDDYILHGRLGSLDPTANPEPITYHDSCNLGRNGGVIEEPRRILNAVAADFREMAPNREASYCCGGGSGLVALPEYDEIRRKAGKPKVDQIRRTGADWVAAACENCRLQLTDLSQAYETGTRVTAIADLVVRAMRLPGAAQDDSLPVTMAAATLDR